METSGSRPAARVASVDVLRGVVMVVMALDHVRDYFGDAQANPTNLATTTAALFATRWITHFCAPAFFLLTGTSAWLSSRRNGGEGLARHLVTRGLWLIVLDAVILRCLALQFNVDFRVTVLIVLWALGWSMIVLAGLVRFRPAVAAAFGLVLVAGHNLLDGIPPAAFGLAAPLWNLLHQPGLLLGPPRFLIVAYPLVPWVGVTALGYALGTIYEWDASRRRTFLLRAGVGATLAFVALRWLNGYGDPQPWSVRPTALFTALSFLNTNKYPPSLLFLLMTLGPALLFLRAVDGGVPRALRPAETLGRVPLFYFAVHFAVIHLLAVVVCAARYGAIHWMFESPTPDRYPFTQPPGWPMSLPVVYAVWALVVVGLWPLCRWYGRLRERRRAWWMRYV